MATPLAISSSLANVLAEKDHAYCRVNMAAGRVSWAVSTSHTESVTGVTGMLSNSAKRTALTVAADSCFCPVYKRGPVTVTTRK